MQRLETQSLIFIATKPSNTEAWWWVGVRHDDMTLLFFHFFFLLLSKSATLTEKKVCSFEKYLEHTKNGVQTNPSFLYFL